MGKGFGGFMIKKIYHGVKGERVTMVEKQNKSKLVVCSPGYGSMTFWKNKDFWKSILLYIGGGLLLVLMLMGFAKTTS
jgi:hypothetical protein